MWNKVSDIYYLFFIRKSNENLLSAKIMESVQIFMSSRHKKSSKREPQLRINQCMLIFNLIRKFQWNFYTSVLNFSWWHHLLLYIYYDQWKYMVMTKKNVIVLNTYFGRLICIHVYLFMTIFIEILLLFIFVMTYEFSHEKKKLF